MTDVPEKGWHPDPYGVHAERYYYADGMPGRLVRDDGRNEFYDDIPDGVPQPEPPVWDPTGHVAPPETPPVAPRSQPAMPVEAHRTGDAPTPRPVQVPAVAEARPLQPGTDDDHWPDEPSHVWSQRFDRWSHGVRKYWAVLSVLGVVIVVAVAFVVFLPTSPNAKTPASSTGGTTHSSQVSHPGLQATDSPGSPGTTSAGPPTAWRVTNAYPDTALRLTALTCPAQTVCDAIGETTLASGLVLRSTDGGATWNEQMVPKGVGTLSAITCPSTTMCLAVGGTTVITTNDGGLAWKVQLLGKNTLSGVACASTLICVVAGQVTVNAPFCQSSATYSTTDGGATWRTTPLSCFIAGGVSCPTTTHCLVVGAASRNSETDGEILSTDDLGLHWHVAYRSGNSSFLAAVTCPSPRVCEAVGQAGARSIVGTNDGGAVWLVQRIPATIGNTFYAAVSCRTTTSCQAVGSAYPLTTGDGGTSWVRQSIPTGVGTMTGVFCPTDVGCLGVATRGVAQGGGGITLSLML